MAQDTHYWTNDSVAALAQGNDPVEVIVDKARAIILDAVEEGWSGPPFDAFQLARRLKIPVLPRDVVLDARLVPSARGGTFSWLASGHISGVSNRRVINSIGMHGCGLHVQEI